MVYHKVLWLYSSQPSGISLRGTYFLKLTIVFNTVLLVNSVNEHFKKKIIISNNPKMRTTLTTIQLFLFNENNFKRVIHLFISHTVLT